MSARPSAPGSSPRSLAAAQALRQPGDGVDLLADVAAPPPRWRGSSSAAQALAASRSQGWVMAVNDKPPGWPKTARSQRVLELLAGRVSQCQPGVAGESAQQRPGRLARGLAGSAVATEAACWRRRLSQTARRFTSVIFAPCSRTRYWIPARTCTTTSGARPRRLTCPGSATAVQASSHVPWPVAGSAVTAVRQRT